MTFPLASSRYALGLLALLGLAWTLTLSFSLRYRRTETCADKVTFFDPSGIPIETGHLAGRDIGKGFLRLDGYVMPTKPGEAVLPFTFRRTYLMPQWLARPTRALPGPQEPDRIEERSIAVDGESVPFTFAYEMGRGLQRFSAYVFIYDHEPVRHPFWVRLLDAPALLARGIAPITYLGVSGAAHPSEIAAVEERALQWLEAAWRHYRGACTP